MASSNRHWPSMFKSKSTYTPHQDHHQWQSPHSAINNNNRSSPYTSGGEERTPEPKPRWNPKPEQIRILESIFNSGMVNPPRDEIRRIRTRLQEYGQVGDANVFYWFQNRKSRSKNKNRHLPKTQSHPTVTKTSTISSSSSSDKSSSSKSIEFFLNSPTVSVNQQPYLGHGEFFQEPFYFPVTASQPPPSTTSFSQGYCFSELGNMIDQQNHHGNDHTTTTTGVSSSGMLLTDLMMNHQYGIPTKNSKSKQIVEEDNIMKMLSNNSTTSLSSPTPTVHPTPTTTINDIQSGVDEGVTGKCIVFINDVPFEMAVGPFNVKEAFGGDAVLFDSSGQTVVTNEWGITHQSLQHGGFYYLVRSFTYDHANANAATIDLI